MPEPTERSSENSIEQELTADSLFCGKLSCYQQRDGYRFSVDSVLAAHFSVPRGMGSVLDLCCGCGVIGLIMTFRLQHIHVTGFEYQQTMVALAQKNILANGLSNRFDLIQGNAREIKKVTSPEIFDMVVCNPPYRSKNSGRLNKTDQAAVARHELTATLADFVKAAAFAVKNKGQVVFVYPAARAASLITCMQNQRLVPKRVQPVYSYPESEEATLVLVEAIKNGGEQCSLLTPFYIYEEKDGQYTLPMERLYE